MIDPDSLLMIEPQGPCEEPVLDELTDKIRVHWWLATHSDYYMKGVHITNCGARSDNRDHWINGILTNSLCLHYIMYHRSEVPESDLQKIRELS